MVNKFELRIGNKVLLGKDIVTLTEVGAFEASFEERNFVYPYVTLQSVPISPELLEACGFDAVRPSLMPGYAFYRSKSWDGRHRFRWDNVEGFAMETVGSGWIWHFKDIQYIHQVQNFIFALTGTELSINLEKVKA